MLRRINRKRGVWSGVVAVLTLLAMLTAVPGLAAPPSSSSKQYKIEVTSPSPNTAPANTAEQTFRVKITNATPDGNSSANSFDLGAPEGFVVTNVQVLGTPSSSNPNASAIASWKSKAGCTPATCPSDDNVVWVQFLDPVKSTRSGAGQFVSIDVTVTTPDIEGCSAEATGWGLPDEKDGQPVGGKTIVYSGSNRSGQTFNQTSATNTTTTLTKECILQVSLSNTTPRLDQSPSDFPITATVTAPDSSFSNQISLVVSPSAGVTITPVSQSGGVATFSITATNTGAYTATASATAADSASATFTVFAGDIDCGETREDGALTRGRWNKDGTTCVIVDYTFDDRIASRNEVELVWDTGSQPTAAFEYTAMWQPEDSTLPPARTEVSYQKDISGNPIWVNGEACWNDGESLTPRLPDPYANLDEAIIPAQTSISVTPYAGAGAAPGIPSAPFDLVIGTERLRVTSISGNTWTVLRGVGGTTAAPHDGGAFVMSTPLPIVGGTQVPVCLASEGWSGSGADEIIVTTRVFDIGDAGVRRG